ncbi:hypothetical protein BC830DRAFT_1078082 [Chytriomyces sp. MP71]|nr:hypothetical protein BC830DRAFT_1078082 [Chytriomyces sp. MP71]
MVFLTLLLFATIAQASWICGCTCKHTTLTTLMADDCSSACASFQSQQAAECTQPGSINYTAIIVGGVMGCLALILSCWCMVRFRKGQNKVRIESTSVELTFQQTSLQDQRETETSELFEEFGTVNMMVWVFMTTSMIDAFRLWNGVENDEKGDQWATSGCIYLEQGSWKTFNPDISVINNPHNRKTRQPQRDHRAHKFDTPDNIVSAIDTKSVLEVDFSPKYGSIWSHDGVRRQDRYQLRSEDSKQLEAPVDPVRGLFSGLSGSDAHFNIPTAEVGRRSCQGGFNVQMGESGCKVEATQCFKVANWVLKGMAPVSEAESGWLCSNENWEEVVENVFDVARLVYEESRCGSFDFHAADYCKLPSLADIKFGFFHVLEM